MSYPLSRGTIKDLIWTHSLDHENVHIFFPGKIYEASFTTFDNVARQKTNSIYRFSISQYLNIQCYSAPLSYLELEKSVQNFLFSIHTWKKDLCSDCFGLVNVLQRHLVHLSQPAITCSKLTIETLEQGVKCVQS